MADKAWWFAVSEEKPKNITVYVNGERFPKGGYVVAVVAAKTPGRVEVGFHCAAIK